MTQTIRQQLTLSGVSNQVYEKLKFYVDLIIQWNKAINLVSPSTLPQIWERHILDSAQLYPIIFEQSKILYPRSDKSSTKIIDLGSGGGLPGLVLAIMGADHVTMIESDQRKCVFLREVSREIGLTNVTVINERIEKVHGITAPIVTARALASLLELTSWAKPFVEENGIMVFPKGQDWQDEIAGLNEHFDEDFVGKIDSFQSVTDTSAKVIVVHNR